MATSLYSRRIGPHHFAHLRAVAEGISVQDAAKRYLAIEHGHQAVTAHRLVTDQVRAAARRRGEKDARLIGLTIRGGNDDKPSLEDFAAERGLDGWSESEIREMYLEDFGHDPKAARRERLRTRQIELLKKLETLVAEVPSPTDFVGGWVDEAMAKKLVTAGITTLGELNSKVSAGGHWFKNLPAVGKAKAARLEAFVRTLMPREAVALPYFGTPKFSGTGRELFTVNNSPALPGSLLGAMSPEQALQAWLEAKATTAATRKVYAREANRLLVWLRFERPARSVFELTVADVTAYSSFLKEVPDRYISKRQAAVGELGWAPFRGQLTATSRQQAISVAASWLDWLVEAQHIQANPFRLIKLRQGDDQARFTGVKAIAQPAMGELVRFFESTPPTPAIHRMRFVLTFGEATGLRASELIAARIEHLVTLPEGLALKVLGKGEKLRLVVLNRQAREALNTYLAARGLGDLGTAPPAAPFLASATDPTQPIAYATLWGTMRRWLERAVSASALPSHEKNQLYKASAHWLRHTFGTRLVEGGAALDAVQSAMGHASLQTTSKYTRASEKRLFGEVGRVFGD